MLNRVFNRVHHIGIVVHDLDRAVRFYESLGIGPWESFPALTVYGDKLDVPDRDDFFGLRYKFVTLGNVQFQLCAPGPGNTPQRKFLESHGEGVFNISFAVNDADEAERLVFDFGLKCMMRGRLPNGHGFNYFDTYSEGIGVNLQLRSGPR